MYHRKNIPVLGNTTDCNLQSMSISHKLTCHKVNCTNINKTKNEYMIIQ